MSKFSDSENFMSEYDPPKEQGFYSTGWRLVFRSSTIEQCIAYDRFHFLEATCLSAYYRVGSTKRMVKNVEEKQHLKHARKHFLWLFFFDLFYDFQCGSRITNFNTQNNHKLQHWLEYISTKVHETGEYISTKIHKMDPLTEYIILVLHATIHSSLLKSIRSLQIASLKRMTSPLARQD